MRIYLFRLGGLLATFYLAATLTLAGQGGRDLLVLTSTNDPSANNVVVFNLDSGGTPALELKDMLPTRGMGGSGGNAGAVQFSGNLGAVANFGSNTVTQLLRLDDFVGIGPTIKLASGCVNPDSVALTADHLFVVGANCAESHSWPWGGC